MSTSTTHHLPEVPNVQDVEELAKQAGDITDILSRLLKEKKWRKGLSPEDRNLLDDCMVRYHAFCVVVDEVLGKCLESAKLFVKLLRSINAANSSQDIAQFARLPLESAEDISNQLPPIYSKRGPLEKFVSSLNQLFRIAPDSYVSCYRGLTELEAVFQRLDASWKVIATYLSSVLNGQSAPPLRDRAQLEDAKRRWQGYLDFVVETKEALAWSSDALKGSSMKQARRPGLFKRIKRWFRKA